MKVICKAIVFLTVTLIPLPLIAQQPSCVKIENDLDRLACYDKESGRIPSRTLIKVESDWVVSTDTSKLTDQTNVFLSLKSEKPVDCGWNKNSRITLTIRCMENKTALYFGTGCHMTSSRYTNYGTVTYRFDDLKAKKIAMNASTDSKALGRWNGGRSIPMIKNMIGKSAMVVRMTPYGENSFTTSFNISGLGSAIKPLRKACGW